MPMRNSEHEDLGGEGHPETILHFTLEGLLPAHQKLVLNPSLRTPTLFSYTPDGQAHIVAQQHFTPNGMRVLVPLLQAYPHNCSYEALHASLFSLSLDVGRCQLHY